MAAWKQIKIMPNLYSRWLNAYNHPPKCEKCGEYFEMGDKAWSHLCPRKTTSYTELYCLMCYQKLWV